MGLRRTCSSNPYRSECCQPSVVVRPVIEMKLPEQPLPNPRPERFSILREQLVGEHLVLMVHYPDCTNFEGVKIMVYSGFKDSAALLAETGGKLDPHFCPHEPSPVARFKPDATGFESAVAYARTLP